MYEALKYIHEHIHENLSLSEISQRFGYSKWHFCAKFHEYTGKTFVKYVRYFRLHLASLDILRGEKILDVATNYGYDSISGFNKAFLTEFGCYPSDYKKDAKKAFEYYEGRRAMTFQLNARCEFLRKAVVETNEHENLYCLQHQVYSKLGQVEAIARGLSNMEIVGAGISRVLESFTPVIKPRELIVGFNFANPKPGETLNIENDEQTISLLRLNGISDEDAKKYFENRNISMSKIPAPANEHEKNMQTEWSAMGRCMGDNHTVIGYEEVLKLGFKGLLNKVEALEQKNGCSALYDSAKKICICACKIGKKYAQEAKRIKDSGDSAFCEEDLDRIIATCERVPEYPARTLMEAIQSLWFSHVINTWEDGINANSLGRLDQILYPYYKSDIEKGILTKDEAFELVCCLWIKLYRNYDVQQSCVGGTSPSGESQVNDLSYMMLDATEQLDFIRCLSVRYSQNTDKKFITRALEVVGHVQKGVPFFFNDDVMIPALESAGISHEDACDYTQIGCVETVIPGKSNPHAVTGETNLLKAVEYTLSNGYSMMYPEMKNGVETGPIESFSTFEEFYDAIIKQIYNILDVTCGSVKKRRPACKNNSPKPYKSLLTKGCMESGKDFNDAGAIYDYYQIMLGGIPNLADSLEVIRKFVYQEKKYTLSELREILSADYPDESVRQEFINKAPKFGNDIPSVDGIAADIVNKSCDILEELSKKYELSFHAQPFTYLWMLDHGRESAASPDGRRKGETIAYSVSPMQGRDFNGLTALLNSISKLPTKRTPGTTSAIVEIDPKLFTDRNIPLLTDILMSASAKGLNNVQFNTIDADMLIDAQKHPEKYNNLAVRVSGFSQKFNLISPELQNHIIARTKHLCL